MKEKILDMIVELGYDVYGKIDLDEDIQIKVYKYTDKVKAFFEYIDSVCEYRDDDYITWYTFDDFKVSEEYAGGVE